MMKQRTKTKRMQSKPSHLLALLLAGLVGCVIGPDGKRTVHPKVRAAGVCIQVAAGDLVERAVDSLASIPEDKGSWIAWIRGVLYDKRSLADAKAFIACLREAIERKPAASAAGSADAAAAPMTTGPNTSALLSSSPAEPPEEKALKAIRWLDNNPSAWQPAQ